MTDDLHETTKTAKIISFVIFVQYKHTEQPCWLLWELQEIDENVQITSSQLAYGCTTLPY